MERIAFLLLFSLILMEGRGQAVSETAAYYDSLAESELGKGNIESYLPIKKKAYILYKEEGNRDREAECCIYLGNYFNAVSQYDSAVYYLTRMDDYARKRPCETSYNLMLTCLSDTYYRMGQVDSAISKEKLSAHYSILLRDTATLLGSYRALGMYERSTGHLEEALASYERALALLADDHRPEMSEERASLYVNLAVLCVDMKQIRSSLHYAKLALKDLESVTNELSNVQAYANLSMVFMEGKELEKAAMCIRRSMILSVKMNDKNMQLRNLGYQLHLESLLNEEDSVDYYISRARSLLPHVQATNTLAGYYQAERDALLSFQRFTEALTSCRQLLQVAGVEQKPFILKDTYEAMGKCYKALGQYDLALDCMDNYVSLNDSLMNTERDKALQELNVKYETKEKELKIVQMESEQRIAEERHRNRLILFCLFVLLLFQLAAVIVWRMRKKNAQMRLYAERQEKALALLRSETELNLTRRYLEGMEIERNRLARELHDGISNDLYALEIKLQHELPGNALAGTLGYIRENVRAISHELMPPSFSELTLKEILKNYVDQLSDSTPDLVFTFQSDPPDAPWSIIPQDMAMMLYRVTQEALGNIIRHAEATHVYVGIELADASLILYIKDDGKGYDASGQGEGGGIGLQTMQERVAALHGTFSITHPAGGHGTLIKCTLHINTPLYS